MIRKRGWYPGIRDWRAAGHGAKHAKKHLPPMWEVVRDKMIGPEFDLNPATNPIVARLEEEREPHPHTAEWERNLDRIECERTKHAPRALLWVALLVLLFTEFAGISQLLSGQGMDNPERSIVAAAGACILFYLTYKAQELNQ